MKSLRSPAGRGSLWQELSMSRAFADISFTPSVRAAQTRYGSREANEGLEMAGDRQDEITDFEREFIEQRDGFYLATVSESGWPYVQFRGGPPGFLKVIDRKTIGFADFRGNVQYLSVGNIDADDRVVLFLMDYAERRRLKVWGRATVVNRDQDAERIAALQVPGYKARVERAIVIHVEAIDWNCPQHITPRYTEAEVRAWAAPLLEELEALRVHAQDDVAGSVGKFGKLGTGELTLTVTGVRILTPRVRAYELRSADGEPLPPIDAGAHLSVPVRTARGDDETRHHWIASDPDDPTRWEIAVQREVDGQGGSMFIHEHYAVGTVLGCGTPKNGFALHRDERPAILIGGGIGIAPLKSMAHVLKQANRWFEIHFSARSSSDAPYLCELQREFAHRLRTHWSESGPGMRLDPVSIFTNAPALAVFYVCGPPRLMAAVRDAARQLGVAQERLRFERFAAPLPSLREQRLDDRLFLDM
jgi:ferredoxin-NADP reductase/predicted pyridoxine 5'-phosphate oxidase superfamily flavin-nucleotide-binding protein